MTQRNARVPTEQASRRGKAETAVVSRRAAFLAKLNDALRLWQSCERPACRRRHRCSHDAHACFQRHWSVMPQEEKEYWRAAFKAGKTTRSAEDMHRAGLAARAACLNTQAPIDKPSAAPAEIQPASTAPTLDAHIRRL